MRFFLPLLIAVLILSQMLSPVMGQSAQPTGDELWQDLIGETSDELIFENLASVAGSACDLYSLGLDLGGLLYDGQWSYVDSLLEVTVLFRNQSWRELIWALNDERERMVDELTSLKKRQCLLRFASRETFSTDPDDQARMASALAVIEGQVIELQAKMQYFANVRRQMLWDQPLFPDFQEEGTVALLPTDKMFYWLYEGFEMNWEQFARDSAQWAKTSWVDLQTVADQFPDSCFGLVNAIHEMVLTFAYPLSGDQYASFRAFVEENAAAKAEEYVDRYCEPAGTRTVSAPEAIGAERQYQDLMTNAALAIEYASRRLLQDSSRIFALIEKKNATGELNEEEEEELVDLLKTRGLLQGMAEYYGLVMQKVGASTSKSLTKLADSLSGFAEAVLGVMKDEEGRRKSRISFSERFEKRKKKQLQQICSRIAAMYSESGRNLADLPSLGTADGKTYCQARLDCEGVNLANFFGGSEGRKKLAECSGFTFSGSELGPSQLTEDVIDQASDDIGTMLQNRALNDLLKSRKLHFQSLRERYRQQYRASGASTAILENVLDGVSDNLYQGDQVYDPQGTLPKTQYSVLKKIYLDFYRFTDEQSGYCSAPEDPSV